MLHFVTGFPPQTVHLSRFTPHFLQIQALRPVLTMSTVKRCISSGTFVLKDNAYRLILFLCSCYVWYFQFISHGKWILEIRQPEKAEDELVLKFWKIMQGPDSLFRFDVKRDLRGSTLFVCIGCYSDMNITH